MNSEEVRVQITGAKFSGGDIVIRTSYYGSSPHPHDHPSKDSQNPLYYDVEVRGLADGPATIRITHNRNMLYKYMKFRAGEEWKNADVKSTDNNSITAEIWVSKLAWTPIVIGT